MIKMDKLIYKGCRVYDGEWAQQGQQYCFKDGDVDIDVYEDTVNDTIEVIYDGVRDFIGNGAGMVDEFKAAYPNLYAHIAKK
jgi:hypothetical protein